MAKNPAAHNIIGHQCPATGDAYTQNDPRLIGYGNPPNSPRWQAENPGKGQLAMELKAVSVDAVDEAFRPDESEWILKPAEDRRGVPIDLETEEA